MQVALKNGVSLFEFDGYWKIIQNGVSLIVYSWEEAELLFHKLTKK